VAAKPQGKIRATYKYHFVNCGLPQVHGKFHLPTFAGGRHGPRDPSPDYGRIRGLGQRDGRKMGVGRREGKGGVQVARGTG
jgi:hypothetical protein